MSDPLYRMKLNVSTRQVGLGITTIESAPVYSIIVTATYEIVKIETGVLVLKGTARGTASYNRVNQVYANTRAKIDAENRAAEAAAMDIRPASPRQWPRASRRGSPCRSSRPRPIAFWRRRTGRSARPHLRQR